MMADQKNHFSLLFDTVNVEQQVETIEEVLDFLNDIENDVDENDEMFPAVYVKNQRGIILEIDLAKTHWAFRIDRGGTHDFDEVYSVGDPKAKGYVLVMNPQNSAISKKQFVPRKQAEQALVEWLEGEELPSGVEWTDVLPHD